MDLSAQSHVSLAGAAEEVAALPSHPEYMQLLASNFQAGIHSVFLLLCTGLQDLKGGGERKNCKQKLAEYYGCELVLLQTRTHREHKALNGSLNLIHSFLSFFYLFTQSLHLNTGVMYLLLSILIQLILVIKGQYCFSNLPYTKEKKRISAHWIGAIK